ncbi:MAG: PH domain-containing protein [Patescibacteria group bacterium]|nr:PH domain-containing protein [Patescibacteria group bacterium]
MKDRISQQKRNSALSAYTENPGDVNFAAQEPGEEVLLLLRRHPITNLPWLLVLLFLILFPFALVLILENTLFENVFIPVRVRILLSILWYLFCCGYALLSFLSWFFNIYLVTDRKIVDLDYFGLLFFRVSETELSQIQDVTYSVSGAAHTLFNYGDIYVQTAAEAREFDFIAVPRPAQVHDLITDLAQLYD